MNSIKKGKYTVKLTHLDKIMLEPKILKGDVVAYYDKIADRMVPYLKNRALMMQRFPEGIKSEFFYQKEAAAYFPDYITRVRVPKEGGYTNFAVVQNSAGLVYLANQDCVTFHTWLSRIDKLHFPDRMIFDLDPSTKDFNGIRHLALELKRLFDALNLISFVMTTGSRGLHVIVPLDRKLDFKEVKNFAHACALHIMHEFPKQATLEVRKEKRGSKIFIDILRNQFGSTSVAPYSIRAREGAPVATPLHWHEVEDTKLSSQKYNIKNIFTRLERLDDPWKDFLKTRQSLKKALKDMVGRETV